MKLLIHTDGGSRGNPGQAAIGFVVVNDQGNHLYSEGKTIGVATNNEAEYSAVQEAYQWLRGFLSGMEGVSVESVEFYLDSQLVARQLNGTYKIKNARLSQLLFSIKKQEQECNVSISYNEIPREKNTEADRLVNQALDDL